MRSPTSWIARSTPSAPGCATASRSSAPRSVRKEQAMNCHECRRWLDDLLIREPGEAPAGDLARHLAGCAECAGQYAIALETVEAITPPARLGALSRLKERILDSIPASAPDNGRAGATDLLPW